jgi:hypothetical protein
MEEWIKKMWWCMPIISALGRLSQEDHKFKASSGYTVKLAQKKNEGRRERKKRKENVVYISNGIPFSHF